MQDALGPLLDGEMDDAQVKDMCERVVRAFKGLGEEQDGSNGGGVVQVKKEDYVVKCDGIILASCERTKSICV